jgi:hypothetical protein
VSLGVLSVFLDIASVIDMLDVVIGLLDGRDDDGS